MEAALDPGIAKAAVEELSHLEPGLFHRILELLAEGTDVILPRLLDGVLDMDTAPASRAGKYVVRLRMSYARLERNVATLADKLAANGYVWHEASPSDGDASMVSGRGGIGNDSAPVPAADAT